MVEIESRLRLTHLALHDSTDCVTFDSLSPAIFAIDFCVDTQLSLCAYVRMYAIRPSLYT
jgi:hypothetical protein